MHGFYDIEPKIKYLSCSTQPTRTAPGSLQVNAFEKQSKVRPLQLHATLLRAGEAENTLLRPLVPETKPGPVPVQVS